ncbi:MAG: Wzz/FepE/Etk N-terminal domain-containing protein [Bacteroidia bacterium]|nr:Wzz/FepE/Etk N-terminal domain-containing protein [Bacteroidia bacterium]
MDLLHFTKVLLRRKWLILAVTVLAMITTFLITRNAPKKYKAHARLSSGITEGNDEIFSMSDMQGKQKYEIEAKFRGMEELIQSPQVLSLVSYQLMLHDLEKTEPMRSLASVRTMYSADEIRVAKKRYKTRLDSLQVLLSTDELERKHIDMLRRMRYDDASLREDILIKRIPGTDYIGIEYESESPYLSAFVVNTLSQEFIRFHSRSQASEARNSVSYFSQMLGEKKRDLDEKMQAWDAYRKTEGVSDFTNPAQDMISLVSTLEEEREKANQEIFSAEGKLIEIDNYFAGEEKKPYLETEVTRSGNRIMILRNRLGRLNNKYVRMGFQAQGILDSLATTRRELAEELFQSVSEEYGTPDTERKRLINQKIDSELRIEIARGRIAAIERELKRLGNQAGTFTVSEATPSSYGKEVELARDAYLTVLNKLNEAKMASQNATLGSVSQLEFVQPPDKPEPSRTLMLVVLAGLITFAISVSGIFLMEYLDTSIRYPSNFVGQTGLKYLAPLNRLTNTNLDLVSLFNETHKNPSLENYKQLLRKVRHEIIAEGPKTLLITSTKSDSGKTSLLISLAYSLSLSGKKVLIIDTNFKDNSLTQITGASPALEKYIKKDMPRKALVSSSVFKGVDVIGCEGGNFSPAEVLDPEDFENLLIELSEQYDHILMEGAPLNKYADSQELSRFAAKVLPVFSATSSIDAADRASIDYLKGLEKEGKLMGSVLNKVEMRNLNQ